MTILLLIRLSAWNVFRKTIFQDNFTHWKSLADKNHMVELPDKAMHVISFGLLTTMTLHRFHYPIHINTMSIDIQKFQRARWKFCQDWRITKENYPKAMERNAGCTRRQSTSSVNNKKSVEIQIDFRSWSTCIHTQGLSSPLPSHPCNARQKLSVECLNNCIKKRTKMSKLVRS